ncbi:MAG: SixA phosphatase family protein [Acidimicrobiales bacterium]
MTLTLLLLRHGKSDWTADYTSDADRPLKRRGREASKLVGRFLSAADRQPELALTSPARRARETLQLACRAGGWSCPTLVSDDLYEQGPPDTIQLLRTIVPSGTKSVLAVGHEPTWSEVVAILTGANIRFPTAAMAYIELDLHRWDTLGAGTGRLSWLVPPRLLRAASRTKKPVRIERSGELDGSPGRT